MKLSLRTLIVGFLLASLLLGFFVAYHMDNERMNAQVLAEMKINEAIFQSRVALQQKMGVALPPLSRTFFDKAKRLDFVIDEAIDMKGDVVRAEIVRLSLQLVESPERRFRCRIMNMGGSNVEDFVQILESELKFAQVPFDVELKP